MNGKQMKAAALRYNQKQDKAPTIAAAGKGIIAENIIEKAKQNNVPMIEDATLVELLAELNINETIPDELYQAVAEVFAFVYRADKEVGSIK
ncbi:EscU/YscU/HrcU family type III secretion system export apparatus switch protein [Virgibacillus necropolis]|uniref:Type III secretion system protein n=1 Tax=Virgibacillus necropolis TaxID=163877 RepID=A0A221MDN1_9BACI|nr:EscU/YscU/HrcU family type III secretion system export apparatus switch protein [Virgibacillus necropolis]ASN05741.1 hypothetical protein CFK40_12335 [Virgibacillus necropolis]